MTKLRRPLGQYAGIDALAVARDCSEAHITFLIKDFQHDVAALAASRSELLTALRSIASGIHPNTGGLQGAIRKEALAAVEKAEPVK